MAEELRSRAGGDSRVGLLEPEITAGRGGVPAVPPAYAAIDLGTNNCRLLIARPADDSFRVIDSFSRIIRLGEGIASTGRIGQAAIDRAIGALSICSEKIHTKGALRLRTIATEACRAADNADAFLGRVAEETGIDDGGDSGAGALLAGFAGRGHIRFESEQMLGLWWTHLPEPSMPLSGADPLPARRFCRRGDP